MTAEHDVPTPEEDAYAMYEALTDPRDEDLIRFFAAQGEPVGHLWAERRRELDELRPQLGLGDKVAEQEAER
jgi:hypothetical protein